MCVDFHIRGLKILSAFHPWELQNFGIPSESIVNVPIVGAIQKKDGQQTVSCMSFTLSPWAPGSAALNSLKEIFLRHAWIFRILVATGRLVVGCRGDVGVKTLVCNGPFFQVLRMDLFSPLPRRIFISMHKVGIMVIFCITTVHKCIPQLDYTLVCVCP